MTPTPAVSAKAKAREAVAAAFKRMHRQVCYPNASDGEAVWAADEILAALPATEGEAEPVACTYCGDTGTITDRVDGEITCPECGYASPPSAPAGVKVKPLVDELNAIVSSYWQIKTADRANPAFLYEHQVRLLEQAAAALARPDATPGKLPAWSPMNTAPEGYPTENAGCPGTSEWFFGRVAKEFRKHGAAPFVVIRRKAWPHEDDWECNGEAHYVPRYFDGWRPLNDASPPVLESAQGNIKPLEWHAVERARSDEDPRTDETGDYTAATPFGCYYIEAYFGSDSYGWAVSCNGIEVADKDDPDAAKAAAQADYESRIRSSLQPDTQAAAASAPAGDIQELASASVRPEPGSVGTAVAVLNKARTAYVNVIRSRSPEGSTSADRRHSEGEISSSAAEAMFEEFGALTFEHVNALIEALEGKPCAA